MRILPQHEQHYPEHLLPQRLEEYVFDDGRPPTRIRVQGAKLVTGSQVLSSVIKASSALGLLGSIDSRYFVATCFHEAGCTNEWDTEIASPSCPEGFVSVGAYQIGAEEAQRFAFTLEDMLDLDKASKCMVHLAEHNRLMLRNYAKLGSAVDPDYTDEHGKVWPGGNMRAYLAIAHNKGLGYAKKTIERYGLDWSAYKRRNPTDNLVAHGYGEDCITGGTHWPTGA